MAKNFTVVGTSVLNGALKMRFATDLVTRIKVLGRNGHDAIKLVECPAMGKVDAAKWVATQAGFGDDATQAVIADFIKRNEA